jgi:hypothetical protein
VGVGFASGNGRGKLRRPRKRPRTTTTTTAMREMPLPGKRSTHYCTAVHTEARGTPSFSRTFIFSLLFLHAYGPASVTTWGSGRLNMHDDSNVSHCVLHA